MSGRRAAYKVARKNAIRNRKRTIFLVLLVAVPVAFGVVVAGIVRASSVTAEERVQQQFGAADAQLYLPGSNPGVADWAFETIESLAPDTKISRFHGNGIGVPGAGYARVTDMDLSDPITDGLLLLLDGRAPESPDEVAISPTLIEELEVSVGDKVEFEDLPIGELEIVGVVSIPFYNQSSDVLLSPNRLEEFETDPNFSLNVFLSGPVAENAALQLQDLWYSEGQQLFWPDPAVDPRPPVLEFLSDEIYVLLTEKEINELVALYAETQNSGRDPISEVDAAAFQMTYGSGNYGNLPSIYVEGRQQTLNQGSFEDNPGLVATGAAALLLVEVAFITGAAFAAGTRRRLREIGLMGANGASEKHVRTTVVGEGLSIGALGALAGVVLGVVVLFLARPLLQRFVSRLIVGLGVSLSDIAGPVAVALLSVLLAVLVPARTASKIPTTTALQGRMPTLSPKKWVVPVGVGASLAGFLLISVSLVSLSNFSGALVGIGAVMVVGGVAMLASPILAGVTKLSDRVPATSRLVLRDSGRNRTRAAVAVAAIMVILLAPITAMTTAATTARKDLVFGLPSPGNHLVVSGPYIANSSQPGPLTDSDVAAVAAVVPYDKVAVFDTLDLRVITGELLDVAESDFGRPVAQQFSDGYSSAIGNEELITVLGDPGVASSIRAGEVVVLGVEEKQTRVSLNGVEFPAKEYAVPVLKWTMPRVLIPESMVSDFADAEARPMALFLLQRPLTDDDWSKLSGLNLKIDGGHGGLSNDAIYLVMAAATLVVVLIVVALVTAVSAAEVDQEIRTIVAVGAPGAFRRRFLALLTGYQTMIAMALAVPLGLGLVWAFSSAVESVYAGPFGLVNASDVTVPWAWIIPFAVLLPIIIGLLTLASVRSAPVTPPRRAT